ncbi:alpha/beta fold hydrolase [Rhodococcus sp. 27YEA15]|uniref:alpha/beta fold hydrolase n=1 Tax=Rhodococcus sp. 27YEA15 TaxID=3156259 RepID=UPI003C7E1529
MLNVTNPVDGTRIAYQVIGDGPPLLMVHGTALSHVIWRGFGYVKALQDHYRLILVDVRGHGRSEKPHHPDSYAMDLVVGDLLAVLETESPSEPAHALGYSFGARAVLSLAVGHPERVRSVSAGGGSSRPMAGAFDALFFPGCIDALETQGIDGFLAGWAARRGSPVDSQTALAFRSNDPIALAAYMRRSDVEPGIDDAALSAMQIPTLLFVGSRDKQRIADSRHAAALIPNSSLTVVEGTDHATAAAASGPVLAALIPFLDDVSRSGTS